MTNIRSADLLCWPLSFLLLCCYYCCYRGGDGLAKDSLALGFRRRIVAGGSEGVRHVLCLALLAKSPLRTVNTHAHGSMLEGLPFSRSLLPCGRPCSAKTVAPPRNVFLSRRWIAAHAALGYTPADMFLRQRSLASDIPNLDKLQG